jgi:hypothetical protein
MRKAVLLPLASNATGDIALYIRQAIETLRPAWTYQPFQFNVPRDLEDSMLPVDAPIDEYQGFDRTLTAYCAAYELDTTNIVYFVDHNAEDGPQFALLPPARRPFYSSLELLAIFRALRGNESFGSLSLRGINLEVLHQLRDYHGHDHIAVQTRTGDWIDIRDQNQKSLLIQELRGLAVSSKRLRRMDFSGCIKRKPHDDDDSGYRDPGCELVEALFPLCRKQWTNVDWITLNGIELGETDLDYLGELSTPVVRFMY